MFHFCLPITLALQSTSMSLSLTLIGQWRGMFTSRDLMLHSSAQLNFVYSKPLLDFKLQTQNVRINFVLPSRVSISSTSVFAGSFEVTWFMVWVLFGEVTGRSRFWWEEFLWDTVTFTCLLAMRPMSAVFTPDYRGTNHKTIKGFNAME